MKKFNQPIELIIQMPIFQIQRRSATVDLCKKLKSAGIDAELVIESQILLKKKTTSLRSLSHKKNNVLIRVW